MESGTLWSALALSGLAWRLDGKRSKASRSDSSIDFLGGARARKDIEVKGDPTGVVAEGDALRAPLSSISFRAKLPPRDQ
jgi:hypothetical protein